MFHTFDELSEATDRLAKIIAKTIKRDEAESGKSAPLSHVITSSILTGYVLAERCKIDLDRLHLSDNVVSLRGNSASEADHRVVIAKAEIEAVVSGRHWGEVIAAWQFDDQIDVETRLIAIDIIHELAREHGKSTL